jgi:hypothetical protein
MVVDAKQSLKTPFRGLVRPVPRRKIPSKTVCFSLTEKQPTSIPTGWSEPVFGRTLHPLKSSAFRGALFRQTRRLKGKPRPETCGLLTIRNALFSVVPRVGRSRRYDGFRHPRPTSTKKSWGAIPPLSRRLVQPREVSETTKAASLVGMASLFDLDGLVGGYRAMAFESPVQHRPPAYGVLSEWRFRNSYPGDGLG